MNRAKTCEYFLNLGYYFLIKYCDRYKFTNLYTNVISGNKKCITYFYACTVSFHSVD